VFGDALGSRVLRSRLVLASLSCLGDILGLGPGILRGAIALRVAWMVLLDDGGDVAGPDEPSMVE